jgi:hypothetical protein|tara:strand:- start:19 stop:333 length:315 start_codon:yes stop_codon:yes gene_type:complete
MEKTVIDLTAGDKLNERIYTKLGVAIQDMLLGLSLAGFDVPVSIKGTNKQLAAFYGAINGEKRYMDAYNQYGLNDPHTFKNKHTLDRAIRQFENETGIRWPFKN